MANTSGVRDAKEAVFVAQMAREALETDWLKLEIHPDPKYLMPDPVETLLATEELAKQGFIIFTVLPRRPCSLQTIRGCRCICRYAPWFSHRDQPGVKSRDFLKIIIEQSNLPVVVDAVGSPSHAAEALEIGASAVLVNTALAVAKDPPSMELLFGNLWRPVGSLIYLDWGTPMNMPVPLLHLRVSRIKYVDGKGLSVFEISQNTILVCPY